MMSLTVNAKVFLLVKIVILFGSLVTSFTTGHLRSLRVEHTAGNAKQTVANDISSDGTAIYKGQSNGDVVMGADFVSRKLREVQDDEDLNCSMPAITRFPRTIFTEKQRENGALVLNFLFAVYLFGAIGYVCVIYFVPSLEIISKMLGIQEDVAGATFMAIGSSAPEFFAAAVGTFVTHDSTGLGAIVGSAAFNVFVIISLCALVAGGNGGLQLSWYPVIRDTVCWVISTVILIAVTFDSVVQWWEGLIMTLCFAGYNIIMYFNKPISACILRWGNKYLPFKGPRGAARPESPDAEMEETPFIDDGRPSTSRESAVGDTGGSRTTYGTGYDGKEGTNSTDAPPQDDTVPEQPLPSVFDPPTSTYLYITWLLGLPLIVALHYTVPDCRKPGMWRRWYLVTFVMSALWLAGLSYVLYWMIVVIGYTLGVSDTVMGYTVLAIGTSVPDAIASVLVAKDGFADMAMANIIGSNIFETLICLGFIWFLRSLTSDPIATPVVINCDGLTVTAISLLLTVSFIIVAIHNNGWKLDLKIGIISLLFYIIFIAWATLNAEGAFGGAFDGRLAQPMAPPCPPDLLDL